MADVVTMPKLGFDMAEGTLVRWVKGEGEKVNKGEVLAEIETDKATVEVESNFSGVLFKYLVEQGTSVPVGTPIAVVAQEGEQPDLTDFMKEDVDVGKERGADREEPSRALPEEPQPKDVKKEESAATVENVPDAPEQKMEAPAETPAQPETGGDGRIKASPLARRMAEEKGVDLQGVRGSGPGGRITRKDVEAAARAPKQAVQAQAPAAAPTAPAAAQPAPQQAARMVSIPMPTWQGGEAPADERVPLSKLRSIIARRMLESSQTVPDFYVTHQYRVERLMALRKEVNALLPDDQKLSVNDFLIKAIAYALRQFPNLNASFETDAIVRHGHVNVGVAVAVESGLLTVVCKDADMKPLRTISAEVKEMVSRAREGKVKTEDIEGSTFSISNLGMFGVDQFTAIINPPESGIIAVGAVQEVALVENGEIKPGQIIKLTLSADHRVTDGAEAARFMQALEDFLQEPMRLLV